MPSKLLVLATCSWAASALPTGPIGAPCRANESASELFTDIDLSGKVAVVTGSDQGIGLEVARALAARRATVVMPGRDLVKMRTAAAKIRLTVPGADLFVPAEVLDLSSFAAVRNSAEGLQRFPAIHVLVNNAGEASTSHPETARDGLEMVFEVDYASQWLLTHLLLPQLRAGRGRIVNVASKAAALACLMSMRRSCVELDRLPPPPISGEVPLLGLPRSNYGIAKLLMIWWTQDVARREAAASTGVTAFSLHPGYVKTSMASNSSRLWNWFACRSDGRAGAPCPTTPAIGALTPTFLALAPGIEHASGGYYEWCALAELPGLGTGRSSDKFNDGLWKLTEAWVANFSAPLSGDAGTDFLV